MKIKSKAYTKDRRKPTEQIYKDLETLRSNFNQDTIFEQQDESYIFPIYGFSTPMPGEAIWLLAGVHGEEPAGPNAICKNIKFLKKMASKGVPMVVLPLLNPLGYHRNWRYPNEARDASIGTSVGDSEHLLLDEKSLKSRRVGPSCPEAEMLSKFILQKILTHPPKVVIDLHEDEDLRPEATWPYIYSQGKLGVHDPLAQNVVDIFNDLNMPLRKSGDTRFNEQIINGIVEIKQDGSVDELLASDRIYLNGEIVSKQSAESVLVIETPTACMTLRRRVEAHCAVIKEMVEKFFKSKSKIHLEHRSN